MNKLPKHAAKASLFRIILRDQLYTKDIIPGGNIDESMFAFSLFSDGFSAFRAETSMHLGQLNHCHEVGGIA
ncbi:MAG: hypothetical protein VXZ82_24760 [Planctomycetota bacterium]|nr:hypothetical protein [Planctomycetota bacterium]